MPSFFVTQIGILYIIILKARRCNMRVIFLGGDMRQKYASEYINTLGIQCKTYMTFEFDSNFIDEIHNFDVIVLPLPVSYDGVHLNMKSNEKITLNDIILNASKNSLILAGNVSADTLEFAQSIGKKIIDYNKNETFLINNALLSAEGAIYYAMEKMSGSVYGSKIAIWGFGRIGKILAYMLKAQGANITIFARKDIDRAWSNIIGYKAVRISEDCIEKLYDMNFDYDIIFNTIPKQVMDEVFISKIHNNTLIIDLASSPYGIDEALAKKYNLNYYHEGGIPGRYAPKSAGNIIGKAIINILEQEKLL
jgi:dipicolinate synthase subunit A